MRSPALLPAILLVAAAARAGETPPPPVLSAATYAAIRDRVLPSPSEEEWRRIPWRAALLGAAREARALDRPILLWAMNGHPLGCT